MTQVVVGMADCRWSGAREDTLVTYALGSCIALTVFDPVSGVGGLLHFMLPDSALDPAGARTNPYKYGDTGIAALLDGAVARGAVRSRLLLRAAGAAQVMNDAGLFQIGQRNYRALRHMLEKLGLPLHGESVGGSMSRTVRLELATGKFWLREGLAEDREVEIRRHTPSHNHGRSKTHSRTDR